MKRIIAPRAESKPVRPKQVAEPGILEQNKAFTHEIVKARPGSTTVPLTLPIARPILQMDNLTETSSDWAGKSAQRPNVLGC